MNVRYLQLGADGLTHVPKSEVIAGWKAGDQPYWVDGVGVSDDWVKEVLADAGAAPIIENSIFTRPRMATSMSAGKSIYFRLPTIVEHRDHLDFFHALWSDQLLVTWRTNETKQTERFIDGLNVPSDAPWVTNMPDIVASLCALLSIDAFESSQRLRQRIDIMSDDLDDTGSIDDDLAAADHQLHALDEATGAYAQVFTMIRADGIDAADHPHARARIDDAINNTAAVARSARTYYNRTTTLRQRQAEDASDRTNHRLGVLSVLSAIFLPLTLLTGIFGMNFEYMPGLDQKWAYPTLLVFMLALAAALWGVFQKRGWP